MPIPASWSGPLLSLLRFMTGLCFMQHGTMKFFVDDVEVHSGASAALISNVVVVHVPYRLNSTTYPFGTVDITRIELCH